MSYWGGIMRDEEGNPSWFRFAATAVLIFSGWFTVRVIRGDTVPESVWDYWLPISLTLIAGAGGPRMVMYLAQMGATIIQRVRGMVGSSYSKTVEEQTTVVPIENDDPVPNGPVTLK